MTQIHEEEPTRPVSPRRPRAASASDCFSDALHSALHRANEAHAGYWHAYGTSESARNAAYMEYVEALESLHTAILKEVTR